MDEPGRSAASQTKVTSYFAAASESAPPSLVNPVDGVNSLNKSIPFKSSSSPSLPDKLIDDSVKTAHQEAEQEKTSYTKEEEVNHEKKQYGETDQWVPVEEAENLRAAFKKEKLENLLDPPAPTLPPPFRLHVIKDTTKSLDARHQVGTTSPIFAPLVGLSKLNLLLLIPQAKLCSIKTKSNQFFDAV